MHAPGPPLSPYAAPDTDKAVTEPAPLLPLFHDAWKEVSRHLDIGA